jgi:hypothetical protein
MLIASRCKFTIYNVKRQKQSCVGVTETKVIPSLDQPMRGEHYLYIEKLIQWNESNAIIPT